MTKAQKIIETLQANGFKAYIVGGVVRDRLLDKSLGDIDIATSAHPEDVMRIFPKTIPIGLSHGTVIVREDGESFEVTTFRAEGEYEDYRRPSDVEFHDSIEEDLARRDFTINAMALKQDGTIIDPYGGKQDLLDGIIRAVGDPFERFQEDPLRMMRGIRFHSLLGFTLHEDTLAALIDRAHLLEKISVERIREEFEKLLAGAHAEVALKLLIDSGMSKHLPHGPYSLDKKEYDFDWKILYDDVQRWSGFLLRIKVADPYDWLKAWRLPNQKRARVDSIIRLVRSDIDFQSPVNLYMHGLESLEAVHKVKAYLGEKPHVTIEEMRESFTRLPIQERSELGIDGNDLKEICNRKPGPWIASLLEQIEQRVLEGSIKNDPSEIKEWITKCHQLPEND
ncbi:CCA tRNA nucleotidyltransferase [Pseudalkalibacillus sp. SCS-8]|uniref:CCA tRNA nucleotidyltransferase n=1 Tax=Pseudalkalibacillus nanhaiensis TaxID=3115291 RepID=UPI0032DB8AB6